MGNFCVAGYFAWGGVYGGGANVCGVTLGSVANLCVGQLYGQRLIFVRITFAWWGNAYGGGANLSVGQLYEAG